MKHRPANANATVLNRHSQLSERFIGELIAQQSELTAVETFALWHDATPVHAKPYAGLLPATPPEPSQQYAFEVDLDTCSGCKACVVACHTLNGLSDTETWRKVGMLASKSAKLPILQHVTTACHHCVDPGCLKGCPVLAYEKDPVSGIVRHLDDQCFGCKYCTMMCPYEVPQYNQSLGIVRKCDMCSQRLGQGEAPACVQACPNQAIKITLVELTEVQQSAQRAEACLVPTAPPSHLTLPTTRFVSRALTESPAVQLVSRESHEDSVQHGHGPLVAMLVLTQASVGAWIALTALWLLGVSAARAMDGALWLATIVGLVGVQAALLHLGRPWLAFRSFLGWRTSWLSREAIAFGVYLPSALAALLASSYAPQLFAVFGPVAAVAGAVAMACSAMIYVATGRALWSLGRTLGEFAATALGLGIAIASLAMPPSAQPLLLLIAGLVCAAALIPKWLDWRRSQEVQPLRTDWPVHKLPERIWPTRALPAPVLPAPSLSVRSGHLLHESLAYQWRVACCSLALSLSVSALAILYGWTADAHSDSSLTGWAHALVWCTSTSLLVVSQATVRWLGFASVVFPRMPGANS